MKSRIRQYAGFTQWLLRSTELDSSEWCAILSRMRNDESDRHENINDNVRPVHG